MKVVVIMAEGRRLTASRLFHHIAKLGWDIDDLSGHSQGKRSGVRRQKY